MRFKEFLTEEKGLDTSARVGLEFQMIVPQTSAGAVAQSLKDLMGDKVKWHAPDGGRVKSPSSWHVQGDETIGKGGVEILSPQLALNDALHDLTKVCDWMVDRNITTNDSTSLKIRIGIPSIGEKLDPVKLVVLDDDHAKRVLGRFAGKFSAPQLEVISQKIKQTGKLPDSVGELEKSAMRFLSAQGSHGKLGAGIFELRVDGGSGYERDASNLKKKVFKMVSAVEIACNPRLEKAEYLQKLMTVLGSAEDEPRATENDMDKIPEQLHRLYKFNAEMNDAWKIFEKHQVHGDARHSLVTLINAGLKTVKDFKTTLNLSEKTLFKKLIKQVSLQSSDVDDYYKHDSITRLGFKKELGI